MEKRFFVLPLLLLLSFMAQSQILSERFDSRVSIGAGVFTDFNVGSGYDNFSLRGINQGISAQITYNFPIGESKHTTSLGVGFSSHNFYMKGCMLNTPYADSLVFQNIEHDYKRAKINVNYIDIPLEVNMRIADMFKISVGFKFGILTTGKTKYVGEIDDTDQIWRIKNSRIENLAKYVYTATLRIAYKSVYVFGAYQFNSTYDPVTGMDLRPLSVGIGVRPF